MASTMRFDNWQTTDGTSIATTNASGDITFAGAVAGAGKILQVATGITTTEVSTTAGYSTYVSAGLTATITPTSTDSDILAFAFLPITIETASTFLGTTIYRGTVASGTNLGTPGTFITTTYSGSTTGSVRQQAAIFVLDSPATTSAITYTAAFSSTNGKVCKGNNHPAHMLLMEVSA